jgi:hypothetical protein
MLNLQTEKSNHKGHKGVQGGLNLEQKLMLTHFPIAKRLPLVSSVVKKQKKALRTCTGLAFRQEKLDSVGQRDGILRLQIAQPAHVLTQSLVLGHQHCRSQLQ